MRFFVPFLQRNKIYEKNVLRSKSMRLRDRDFTTHNILDFVGLETIVHSAAECDDVMYVLRAFSLWTALGPSSPLVIVDTKIELSDCYMFNVAGPTLCDVDRPLSPVAASASLTSHYDFVEEFSKRDAEIVQIETALRGSKRTCALSEAYLKSRLMTDIESEFLVLFAGLESYCERRQRSDRSLTLLGEVRDLLVGKKCGDEDFDVEALLSATGDLKRESMKSAVRRIFSEELPELGIVCAIDPDELYRTRNALFHRNDAVSTQVVARLKQTIAALLRAKTVRDGEARP